MPDELHLPTRLTRDARLVRGERALLRTVHDALTALGAACGRELRDAGMDASILDSRHPEWQAAIDDSIIPAVRDLFTTGWSQETRLDDIALADSYADAHLRAVRNRMVGVSDEVFRQISASLAEGRQATFTDTATGEVHIGESIPQLAARVDAILGDAATWRNRAVTVARTETIAANNAGAHAAAAVNAQILGTGQGDVVKEWLATSDTRTRETHADADGQQVLGMSGLFTVGDASVQYPGDPSGPAAEVINCRCTTLYHYPGDPDYPVTAAARTSYPDRDQEAAMTLTAAPDTAPDPDADIPADVILAVLPAPDDPCQAVGEEDKHATLLFCGTGDTLPTDVTTLRDAVAAWVTTQTDLTAITAAVTGVTSLGPDGARVWTLDGSLDDLRTTLLTIPEVEAAWSAVKQYPKFVPHVTFGYPETAPVDAETADEDDAPDQAPDADDTNAPITDPLDDATEQAAAAITVITFDRLALWAGEDQTEWPLAAAPAEAPPGPGAGGPTPTPGGGGEQTAAAYADTPPVTPTPVPGAASDIAPGGAPFYGILCPEGVLSGDARRFAVGAITWRDLPLPLMYQDATAFGHDGAVRVGRIDSIEKDDTDPAHPMVRYTGSWDTSEVAQEAQRQVGPSLAEAIVRGVSVDCDDVTVQLVGSDGQALDPMVDDFPADGVVIEDASEARICGATICSVPAFPQAYIANGVRDPSAPEPGMDSLVDDTAAAPNAPGDAAEGEAVAASAWTLVASGRRASAVDPAVFANPGLTEPTGLTITDDGRVYGHLAVWGVCHIGIEGVCQEAPDSPSNYAYFATGYVDTADGPLSVGQLTMGTGHAAMNLRAPSAVAHYDNTGTVVADVRMGQDGVGIWYAGRLRPEVTEAQRFALKASGRVSGDWRKIGGTLELVAALVVNVPGFPLPRPALAASAAGAEALVASGIVDPPRTPADDDRRLLLHDLVAAIDRRDRVRRALTRMRSTRAAAAAARIDEGR
jgi:hypothetical protein